MGGPSAGSKCKFPFIFESQRYDKCTKVGEIGTFWCATEIDDSGEMIPEKWGICAYYCDIYGNYRKNLMMEILRYI